MTRIFAAGSNLKGQLGLGGTQGSQKDETIEESRVFEEILNLESFMDDDKECEVVAAVGANHIMIALSNLNFLWVAGDNQWGQLGGGIKEQSVGKMMRYQPEIDNLKIRQLFCGWDYSFLIDNQDRVWSTGSNKHGLIGHCDADTKRDWSLITTSTFATHNGDPGRICKIACGWRHTLFLSCDGNVFGVGNLEKVNLGERIRKDGSPDLAIKQLIFLKKIIDLACGMFHSVFLSESFDVIVVGRKSCSKYGILIQDFSLFKKELQDNDYSIAVYSGWSSLAFKTKQGVLWTWGRADLGQLGRHEREGFSSTPKRLIYNDHKTSKVKRVSMGSESSLVLLECGKVLVFGFNDHGNLGLGHAENIMSPTYLEIDSLIYTGVASGFGNSVIW